MVLYYSAMVTTRAGHAKKRAAELAASVRLYQHPPSFDDDVDNIGLLFEELKQIRERESKVESEKRKEKIKELKDQI